MKATEILMEEHRIIELIIVTLETGEGIHEKYLALAHKLAAELVG